MGGLSFIHKSKISEPMALLPPLPRIVRELRLPSQETIAANELGERYYGKGGLVAATLLVCFITQIQE